MEVQIAVAKVNKYAVSESGDTLEVVERPGGGLSVVLADGQTSGRGAKAISQMVVRKVISLLAEGVRDGAAARAASDALYTDKQGKVISTLNIASLDLSSGTIVLTRNNPAPIFICRGEEIDCLDEESIPLGTSRNVRPLISEVPIEPGLIIVIYTDGLTHAGKRRGTPMDIGVLTHAGKRRGTPMDIGAAIRAVLDDEDPGPQAIADELLAEAVSLDENRTAEDIR